MADQMSKARDFYGAVRFMTRTKIRHRVKLRLYERNNERKITKRGRKTMMMTVIMKKGKKKDEGWRGGHLFQLFSNY